MNKYTTSVQFQFEIQWYLTSITKPSTVLQPENKSLVVTARNFSLSTSEVGRLVLARISHNRSMPITGGGPGGEFATQVLTNKCGVAFVLHSYFRIYGCGLEGLQRNKKITYIYKTSCGQEFLLWF